MAREKFEFLCTECKLYFDIILNTSLDGWFRIHCPNEKCHHIHYRKVKKGQITEERFTNDGGRDDPFIIEDIIAMPSSCRTAQEEKADKPGADGFVQRLWREYFSVPT